MRIIKLSFFLLIITACSESDLMIHKQNGLMLEDLKEKNTVINFWADWCPPCIKEIPEIVSFAKKYPEVEVFAFNFDRLEAEDLRTQIKKFGIKRNL